jgi:hypothetical protein
LITIKSKDLSESQLAEIGLAIQKRWEIPVFVKMHEIVILDDEPQNVESEPGVITLPLDPKHIEKGLGTILENLEMDHAFKIEKKNDSNFSLALTDPEKIPSWMNEIGKPQPVPDGVFACPHCGKWFNTEIERSLHQKLHYII